MSNPQMIHVRVVPVVSASPNYTAGDSVGAVNTLTRVGVGQGRTCRLKTIKLTDLSNQGPALRLLFFGASPTGTYTDNSALDLSAADIGQNPACVKILASDYETHDSYKFVTFPDINEDLYSTDYNIYFAIIADDAWNAASVADLSFDIEFEVAT